MTHKHIFHLVKEFEVSSFSDCASVHRLMGEEHAYEMVAICEVLVMAGLLEKRHGGVGGYYAPTMAGSYAFDVIASRADYIVWCSNE